MGVLFARTFTQQGLLDAWQEVRDAALADGRPDAELDEFEADAARRVSLLAVALAEGQWRPLPAHQVEITKPTGGTRRLTIPPLADRVVERALLATLDREIDPSLLPWSFAYRRGLGVRDAIAALTEARDSGASWVARADIHDCFDRIPRWEVMRLVRERVDDERIAHLVGLILDRPVVNRRAAPDDRGRGLHQGSVLAPLLSNLYLDTFDRRMLAAGYRVIRYSDDFAIPVENRLDGEKALRTAGTELEDLHLELNTGKCDVVSFDDGVRFLGELVTASTLNSAETLSHPLETVVYVEHQGAYVRTRGDRLVVTDGDESLLRLSLRRVRQVVCYGRVGLSTPFLREAAQRGIEIVLLDENGTDGGRLTPLTSSDPTARRAQYRAADDPGQCRTLAAAFVTGKVSNMRVTLLRTARRQDDLDAAEAADRLEKTLNALDQNPPLEETLGLEGSAARHYFQAASRLINPEWGFTTRQRRPPPDPVNAMLSYGYTLLVHEAIAALETAALDPMVGYLHRHRWGRPALALDLMEEFRPITVDVAVWRCISTRIVRPEQFHHELEQGSRMGDDARHAFLAAYERRMLTLTTHPDAGRRVSFRVALSLQAKAVARTLLDPSQPYRPLRWK